MASGKKNYFRHSFFARNDDVVMDFIDKFGFQGYFLWFALLEICGEIAAESYPEIFIIHKSRLYRELRCRQDKLRTFLGYAEDKLRISWTCNGNNYHILIHNFPKYLGKYNILNDPNGPNKRKEKKRKEKKIKNKKKETLNFDFENVYASYPKKIGKTKGIERCCAKIKTAQQYSDLQKAVANYAQHCKREDTEKKYIKQFSTFMGVWEDYIDLEIEKTGAEKFHDFLSAAVAEVNVVEN